MPFCTPPCAPPVSPPISEPSIIQSKNQKPATTATRPINVLLPKHNVPVECAVPGRKCPKRRPKLQECAVGHEALDREQTVNYVLCSFREDIMFRAVVEEAAALTSIALFVGMIAIWAQLISAM